MPKANRRKQRRHSNAKPRAANRRRVHHTSTRHHHRTHRRRNPASPRAVYHVVKSNRRRRGRNPMGESIFGVNMFGKQGIKLLAGGILGVTVTKFLPTLLPASLVGGIASSNFGRTIITGISAVVSGWIGSKLDPMIGTGMLFGGGMQTLSVALNAFLPSVWSQLNAGLGGRGMGYFVPGRFPVPQNPVNEGAAMYALPPGAATPMSGLARAGMGSSQAW